MFEAVPAHLFKGGFVGMSAQSSSSSSSASAGDRELSLGDVIFRLMERIIQDLPLDNFAAPAGPIEAFLMHTAMGILQGRIPSEIFWAIPSQLIEHPDRWPRAVLGPIVGGENDLAIQRQIVAPVVWDVFFAALTMTFSPPSHSDDDSHSDDLGETVNSMLMLLFFCLEDTIDRFRHPFNHLIGGVSDVSISRGLESLDEYFLDVLEMIQKQRWKDIIIDLSLLALTLPISPVGGAQRLCSDMLETIFFDATAKAERRWQSCPIIIEEHPQQTLQALITADIMDSLNSYPAIVSYLPFLVEIIESEVLASQHPLSASDPPSFSQTLQLVLDAYRKGGRKPSVAVRQSAFEDLFGDLFEESPKCVSVRPRGLFSRSHARSAPVAPNIQFCVQR